MHLLRAIGGLYYRCIVFVAVNTPVLSDVISACTKRVAYAVLLKAFLILCPVFADSYSAAGLVKSGGIQQGPTDGNPQVISLGFTVNLPEILPAFQE